MNIFRAFPVSLPAAALLAVSIASRFPIRGAEPASGASSGVAASAAALVTERDLRAWVEFLAAPELEGRNTGERGYDVASRYVASELRASGIEPGGGDGSYYQPFDVIAERRRPGSNASISVRPDGRDGGEEVSLDGEFSIEAPSESVRWTGPWVFAGWGRGPESDSVDDFAGLSLEDSVVVVVPRRDGQRKPYLGAALSGARRIVVVSDRSVRRGHGLRQGGMRLSFQIAAADRVARAARGADVVYLSTAVAGPLLARWDIDLGRARGGDGERPEPRPLSGHQITLDIPLERDVRPSRNVVGILEGSDPALRNELIVIGAHLDHVGTKDDKIFFGADDNASGSAAVLAAARALGAAERRPRRSVAFVWFGAEEVGLLGSSFFVQNAPVSVDDIVMMVNLDMVGRNESHPKLNPGETDEENRNTLHPVGAAKSSPELRGWIDRVNEAIGFDFEPDEDDRVWNRSDQWNFIREGVPAVFFFAGFHPDYHQPTDTVDKLNFDKIVRVAKLVVTLVFEVADRPQRLRRFL